MPTDFSIQPDRDRYVVVGPDGRVYAGVERFASDSPRRAMRTLEIVREAYDTGRIAAEDGEEPPAVGIVRGAAPRGRDEAWRIEDGTGTIYGAVSKGIWPRPSREAVKLKEIVEFAMARGFEHAHGHRSGMRPN